MFSQFLQKQKQHCYIQEGDSIVVAFSGGADSVFLVEMLLKLQRQLSFQIVLAHFHHQLRGEFADRDASFSENYAKKKKLPYVWEKKDVLSYAREHKKSIEEAARELRYDFLERVKEQYSCNKIATGHHLDDHLETFFFRLLRGSSIQGLKGIARIREDRIRPLRDFEKKEILEYLEEEGIAYCIDETNEDTRYTRNKIRNELLPQLEYYNPKWKEKVAAFMEDLEDYETEVKWEECLEGDSLSLNKLRDLSKEEQKRVLYQYVLSYGISASRKQIEGIQALLFKGGSLSYDLKANCRCKKIYNHLYVEYFEEEEEEKNEEKRLLLPGRTYFGTYEIETSFVEESFENSTYVLDLDEKESLILRTYREGDRMLLPGMKEAKKLKEIFINMKVPKEERRKIPLVVYQDKILAIGKLRKSAFILRLQEKRIEIKISKCPQKKVES